MSHPQLGVGHRAPMHVAVLASNVVCAITRREQPILRCSRCVYFQGMLVGPDLCVLCAAPARRPSRPTARGRRRALVFNTDWPDEPG